MRPISLILQAFGSYGERTEISFERTSQNLFLITGDTGSGKSTIFDAIVFALYGEAGSTANRKDGVVLQSQYTDYTQEPFVALTFSEGSGSDRRIYTVRRVPRHLKRITRGAAKGTGVREVTGSVTLTMPDGTAYPPKETDGKLEELVGLTKHQFMQVAMIAQGEFMELLRAKSDAKKLIFRKLFHTELYAQVTEELANRRREKDRELATLQTVVQAAAARVQIPAEDPCREVLSQQKEQVLAGGGAALEAFLETLSVLCEKLQEKAQEARQAYQQASSRRDQVRATAVEADHLAKLYAQLHQAEVTLQACSASEPEIRRLTTLAGKLSGVWLLQSACQRAEDAQAGVRERTEQLQMLREELPQLQAAEKAAADAEAEQKEELERRIAALSRTAEQVEKAKELFRRIAQEKQRYEAQERLLAAAEQERKRIEHTQLQLEKQTELWKTELESLAAVEKRQALWEQKYAEAEALIDDWTELGALRARVQELQQSGRDLQERYAKVRQAYQEKHAYSEELRQTFLDAQAGVLARQLVPGRPCPVCGATTHPSPCRIQVDSSHLSREAVERAMQAAEQLRAQQEELAGKAREATVQWQERKEALAEKSRRMLQQMQKHIPELPEKPSFAEAQTLLTTWKESLQKEEAQIRQDLARQKKLTEAFAQSEEQKKQLQEQLVQAQEQLQNTSAAREGSRAALMSLQASADFPDEAQAVQALTAANGAKERKEKEWRAAKRTSDAAAKRKSDAEALIRRYEKELPDQQQQFLERQALYRRELSKGQLSEEEWRMLAKQYRREQENEFRERIEAHRRDQAAAEKLRAAALEAINGKARPELEKIQAQIAEAERQCRQAQERQEQLQQLYRENQAVREELAPKLAKRKVLAAEYTRLDTLYRMASGNVSGARMDLETYVQRYYLEQILQAANRRFYEMSAGQFELRMYELEKAGEGKNRGLDLMVYSNVTGKAREVRTLSGGESFMAALSLALGLADQIQVSSSAIQLDMMFIDEGFGSLDEHSRNQAVRVLQEMAGGSRLIGIISHVTELKQEIEDQLIVRKDETGSHVRWQIS